MVPPERDWLASQVGLNRERADLRGLGTAFHCCVLPALSRLERDARRSRAVLVTLIGKRMKALALLFAVFALSACEPTSRSEPPAPHVSLADEPEAAKRQIEQFVPPGTPQTAAEDILKKKGFSVSVMHGAIGAEHFADYLYCDYRDGGSPVSRRWQAALVLKDGRVVDYRVTTGLTGP